MSGVDDGAGSIAVDTGNADIEADGEEIGVAVHAKIDFSVDSGVSGRAATQLIL